jgi:hypothetical protein
MPACACFLFPACARQVDPPPELRPDALQPGWTEAFLGAVEDRLALAAAPPPSSAGADWDAAPWLDEEADAEGDGEDEGDNDWVAPEAPGGPGSGGVSHTNLANLMYSLALLGVRPGRRWLEAVMTRVVERPRDFGDVTLNKVAWALPQLAGAAGAPRRRGPGAGGAADAAGFVRGRGQDAVPAELLREWQGVLEARSQQLMLRRAGGARPRVLRARRPGAQRRSGG